MRQTRAMMTIPALAAAAVVVGLSMSSAMGASPDAPSPAASVTGTWFDGLEPSVCFDLIVDTQGQVDFSVPVTVLPCAQPHGNEVVARLPLGDAAALPSDIGQRATNACGDAFTAFLGRPVGSTTLFPFPTWPDAADWVAGAHDAVCIVAGSGLIGTAASDDLRAPGEQLAAWYQPGASAELWIVDGGSGELVNAVTDGSVEALLSPPAWTPDGTRVAFSVQSPGDDADIVIAGREGGPPSPLVAGPGRQNAAVVSPDGTTIAYSSNEAGGEYDIFVRPFAGIAGAAITDHPGRDATPRWSPDGSGILFRRVTDGLSEIWLMNADGTDAARLIDNGVDSYDPRWSPDGGTILFTTAAAGSMDIWAANADGSDPRQLTDHPGAEGYPTYSSDGRFIAFQSDRYGSPTLWLMNADGTEVSLLSGVAPMGYPSFSPVRASD